MIERIATLSLIITAIHVTTWDGMIFHRIALLLGDRLESWHFAVLRKPLWECLICMGGIYTLVLYPLLYGWAWAIIPTMLGVIGLNTIISALICHMHE